MSNSANSIRQILASHADKSVKPLASSVWQLTTPRWGARARLHHALRSQVLTAALTSAQPMFMTYSEDPNDELGVSWSRVDVNIWRMHPRTVSAELLSGFLHLGNWTIVAGSISHLRETLAKIRGKPDQIAECLDDGDMDLIIDSYHDDNPWWIGVKT